MICAMRGGEDDAAFVVALLDGGADDARDADAVAAHFHDLVLALLIQERAFQRLGVLGAQLEDVADLDAAAEFERPLAVGRRIALDHVADVGDGGRWRQVAAEIDAGEVEAFLVGAADHVAHHGDTAVGHHLAGEADRADVAGLAAQRFDDFFVARETECADDLLRV